MILQRFIRLLRPEADRLYGKSPGSAPRRLVRRGVILALALCLALSVQGGVLLLRVGDAGSRAVAANSVVSPVQDDDDDSDDWGDDDDSDDWGDNDDDDDDEKRGAHRTEWEGVITSLPGTLTGTWTLMIETGSPISVAANNGTRFDTVQGRAFAVGSWVEVDGVLLPNGRVIATRIRLDEYEESEIVVRLNSLGYSSTLASKYGLVFKDDLLRSANILLFSTGDDDEDELVEEIAADDNVEWAELNYVSRVPEGDGYRTWGWGGKSEPTTYANQSAYLQVRLGMSARQFDGEGITVAILDTGVYTAHERLVDQLQVPSFDVIDDDADPSEEGPGLALGHGTHVAGIVAAMAPEATLLPVRVLDANGRGNTFLLAYAIEWAVEQGADVINLSLGTPHDSKILGEVITSAIGQGVVVAAAAGNGDTDQVQYPAGYEGVLGVTAVDDDNRKADFANYGEPWVDLAAPGVGIMSTIITDEGPGYAKWSGTSMATAFVSGGAVLVEQHERASAASRQAASRMLSSGIDIGEENPSYERALGRLLNVSGALNVEPPIPSTVYMPKVQQ